MKRLLLAFLVAASPFAKAHDIEDLIKTETADLAIIQKTKAELLTRQTTFQEQIKSLPPDSPRAGTLRQDQAELEMLLTSINEHEKRTQDRLQQLKNSPLHHAILAIRNEHRQPTRQNLSGVWVTKLIGAIGPGYVFRLDQQGETIAGQGYLAGCLGIERSLQVTGTYKNEVLSLTFQLDSNPPKSSTYHYSGDQNHLSFETQDKGSFPRIEPVDLQP